MAGIRLAGERAALKPRRDPYFEPLGRGLALGFRKMSLSSNGSWLARYHDKTLQKQIYSPLGDFAQIANADRYAEAAKAAHAWFKHIQRGGSPETFTVKAICERYVDWLLSSDRIQAGHDNQKRFERFVYAKPIASVEITKLTPLHMDLWRKELSDTPTLSGPKTGQRRSDSSINRDMTCIRAALNKAYEDGLVTSDFAWKAKLKPIKNADRRRDVYLSPEDRKTLIANSDQAVRPLLKAMCLLPLRPGAFAHLRVKDFDEYLGTLTIGKDKHGMDRKIALPEATANFFAQQTVGKAPQDPIFTQASGKAWRKDDWKGPAKNAFIAADLNPESCAYTLRHSTITDLVLERLDIFTVAKLSGTSVAMIERHYGHLTQDHAKNSLALLTVD